jgi:hypothetical protein
MKEIEEISGELQELILRKGYATRTGAIKFPKAIRDMFRKEIEDSESDTVQITTKMIDVYNGTRNGFVGR